MTSSHQELFPHPRRIVTGHTSSGASTVVKDGQIPCLETPVKCNFAVLYETSQFPASNDEPFIDPADSRTASLANSSGVVLRVVDFPPRTETLYHRTISLDFGILFAGEIDCRLDNNEVIHMKPGDVCVQRGTIHGWTNPHDKPARMYFVLTAAEPVKIDSKPLDNAGFEDHEVGSGGKEA